MIDAFAPTAPVARLLAGLAAAGYTITIGRYGAAWEVGFDSPGRDDAVFGAIYIGARTGRFTRASVSRITETGPGIATVRPTTLADLRTALAP